ncbi:MULTISPECIES: PDDEXK nuclease domain-containing protein [Cupriavidus]|uniref:PDDEXK nuclease domain-containing protein n=1 Tax=Cupriavidus sp. DF5525 TaxID=3160989 RepID=UPI0035A95194
MKTGAFEPEYAGQISFYLSAVDALMKTEADHPTIGLLLCQGAQPAGGRIRAARHGPAD